MGSKFRVFAETSFYYIFEGFNFRRFVMGVITTPFSGLLVQWYMYLWISEQVMIKENNTRSFSSVVSGWTKVTKERHSELVLPSPWPATARVCVGIVSQKFH